MDKKSQYTPFNSESQKIEGLLNPVVLVNPVVVKNEPEKDDSNMTIFGIMDNILDNFENEIISGETLNRIHDALKNRLKYKFDEYKIVTTNEEQKTLIKAMIEEYSFLKFVIPSIYLQAALAKTRFMQISFKTLKNIINPAIKNVKVEVKIDA